MEKERTKPTEHAKLSYDKSFISFEMPVAFYRESLPTIQETVHLSAKPELPMQSLALKNTFCFDGT